MVATGATGAARATGLEFRDGAVSGVHCVDDAGERVERAEFIVDTMGRASRLPDYLAAYLTDSPGLGAPAEDFFALQKVAVDAAWDVSAGADIARLAVSGSSYSTRGKLVGATHAPIRKGGYR